MTVNPTYQLCANFGHNFVREHDADINSDVVTCKHCKISVEMDNNGNYEEELDEHLRIHQVMKKLFLLKTSYRIRHKTATFSFH